jgi:hypothetical protein
MERSRLSGEVNMTLCLGYSNYVPLQGSEAHANEGSVCGDMHGEN